MERLVIYDAHKMDPAGLYQLGNEHKNFVIGQRDHPLSPDTADETTTIAVVFVSSRVDRAVLARMPHLKLIVSLSVGINHIDLAECRARGITVCNTPTYGEQTVAEYTMALMLALTRRLPEAVTRLRNGEATHADLVGTDLAGKTLTVIGTGHIGRNVAKYARVFGMNVLGVDPYPSAAAATELGFEYVGLHDGLRQADILTLHAPYTKENHHLINKKSLEIMKPGALLVNTARGELIDTTAMLYALHTDHIGGVALDVIEGEALLGGAVEMKVLADGSVKREVLREIAEHEALLKLPNVIITNHNAYNTHEAQKRMMESGVATVTAFLQGKPINVVNAQA